MTSDGKIEVRLDATRDDLKIMCYYALCYCMGRRCISGVVANFIIDNLALFDEKWIKDCLRDIGEYERKRGMGLEDGGFIIDEIHHEQWLKVKDALLKACEARGYKWAV